MPSLFSKTKPQLMCIQDEKHLLYSLRINGKHFAYERQQHEIVITSRYQNNSVINEKQSKLLSELADIMDKLKQIIETACEIKPIYSSKITDFAHIEETLTIQNIDIGRKSNRLLMQITRPGEFDKVEIYTLGELSIQPSI